MRSMLFSVTLALVEDADAFIAFALKQTHAGETTPPSHLHPTSLPAEIYFWKQFNGLLITLIGFVSRWLLISALLRSLKRLHDGGKLVQPGAARGCASADGSCRLPQDRGTDINTALWVSQQGEPLDTRMAEHQQSAGKSLEGWIWGAGRPCAPGTIPGTHGATEQPLGKGTALLWLHRDPWHSAPFTPQSEFPSDAANSPILDKHSRRGKKTQGTPTVPFPAGQTRILTGETEANARGCGDGGAASPALRQHPRQRPALASASRVRGKHSLPVSPRLRKQPGCVFQNNNDLLK